MNELQDWFLSNGASPGAASAAAAVSGLLAVGVLSFLANLVAKKVILRLVNALIARSRMPLFLILQEHKVFTRLSHIAPAAVLQTMVPSLLGDWPAIVGATQVLVSVYLICVGLLVIDALLNALLTGWEKLGPANGAPIKGFVQAVKLLSFLVGLVLIISVFLDKEPVILISGLGALTAVLLLVFKDAILGFVAGIQLSVNDMVRKGDWIEMPKQGADGDVVDVSLTTVKVQNWDRTITTIPSYLLISDSFKNWRGMTQAGGRRIKRAIHLDMRTIRFLDEELLGRCKKIRLLQPYLEKTLEEIQRHNRDRKLEIDDLINGRNLTNIGTFRAYCIAYLRDHPKLHPGMTQLVRQLEPTPQGLPLEIYTFSSDTAWANYEAIQADIFDHLLAVLPQFGLRTFQQPSGADVEELGRLAGWGTSRGGMEEGVLPAGRN